MIIADTSFSLKIANWSLLLTRIWPVENATDVFSSCQWGFRGNTYGYTVTNGYYMGTVTDLNLSTSESDLVSIANLHR